MMLLCIRLMRPPALESEALCFAKTNFQHDSVPSSFPRAGHQPSSQCRTPNAQQSLSFEILCSIHLLSSAESGDKGVDHFLPLLMDFVVDKIV